MSARRPAGAALALAASLLALAPIGALAGCGQNVGEDPAEPRREGLALELEGVTYNVFLTRQLNPADVEDKSYTEGVGEAPPGSAYFGVFLEACNVSDRPLQTATSFLIEDTQGNEFEPLEPAEDNPFAYKPETILPGDCIPPTGSVASEGPTAGALLVFEIPIESTENRPLELKIQDGYDFATAEPRELIFELDI
jgi:hypothetical protein